MKGIQIEKEKIKSFFITNGIFLYIENPKHSQKSVRTNQQIQ